MHLGIVLHNTCSEEEHVKRLQLQLHSRLGEADPHKRVKVQQKGPVGAVVVNVQHCRDLLDDGRRVVEQVTHKLGKRYSSLNVGVELMRLLCSSATRCCCAS